MELAIDVRLIPIVGCWRVFVFLWPIKIVDFCIVHLVDEHQGAVDFRIVLWDLVDYRFLVCQPLLVPLALGSHATSAI